MNKNIDDNQLLDTSTIKDVMQRLNCGVFGAVFLTNKQKKVIGMFTDGDVRRALLNGAKLSSKAIQYMNSDFVSGSSENTKSENMKLLSELIRHVPILDNNGRLVELLSWAEMLNLPVMAPSLGGNELKYVSDCILSGWISSQGKFVSQLESEFSKYQNGAYCIAVSSGTAALHLALKAIDIGPGDEVIIPNLTFAATANVVLHCGAKPVCVDVDPITWTIDVTKIYDAINPKTRAIIPVHLYGHPCDMDSVMEIADKYNLKIIEDCAEAQGATYKHRNVGGIGHIGCFSFFSNKVITTGEGGMVTTGDTNLASKIRILRDHGMSNDRKYWHEIAGFNYRMTNLQAAVGVAQMERFDKFLARRREIGKLYIDGLKDIPGLIMPPKEEWANTIFWIFSILIDDKVFGLSRDNLIKILATQGIETRPFFYPLNEQPPYHQRGNFDISIKLSAQGISLPSGNNITNDAIESVCNAIRTAIPSN